METETDVQKLIKELAATGADPFWVAEAIALEQEAAARSKAAAPTRPQLRLVVADQAPGVASSPSSGRLHFPLCGVEKEA
jgi:hypothetical protein